MKAPELADSLAPIQRLALAYAPASSRAPLLALLALDARLAAIVRSAREPLLAQLRLAWWREQLSQEPGGWPQGEPLLAALRSWWGDYRVLAALADGWEAMTGPAPLPPAAFQCLAEARGEAFAELAGGGNMKATALRFGRNWALADIASRVASPQERQAALDLARSQDWRRARLPRALRPLAVLHALAARNLAKGRPADSVSPGTLLIALRTGLFCG